MVCAEGDASLGGRPRRGWPPAWLEATAEELGAWALGSTRYFEMQRVGAVLPKLVSAGLLAPIVFTALVIAQGLLQPDYSHKELPISALAAWPLGWVQVLNFFILGLLLIAYAIGLHVRLCPSRGGMIGPALLVISGLGVITAGIFPWRNTDGLLIEPAGHVVGALMSFLGAAFGHMVISRRVARDPNWQSVAFYVLASGAAMLVLFFVFAGFALDPGTPLHPWAGVLQRITVLVWFGCTTLLALKSRRVKSTAVPVKAVSPQGR
jgi:hypothetical membrane protein